MIVFDKDHFYITLMNIIEYPPLYSNIYEEYEIYYINRDFKNGIGNRTLFYHFQLLFDSLLKSCNNQNRTNTHLSKHELHNIYPNLDHNEINQIFNAINIKSKNIDIYEFINFILSKCSNKQLDMIMRSLTQESEYLPQPESEIDHQLNDVSELEIDLQPEEDVPEPEIEPQFELDDITIPQPEPQPESEIDHQLNDISELEIDLQPEEDVPEPQSDIHLDIESQEESSIPEEESSYEQEYNNQNKPSNILQTLIQYITFLKNKFQENLRKLFEFNWL